jgi:hypothetical protein
MHLPNGDRAIVDEAKLRAYCLSTTHPRRRHKARLFAATLGMTMSHADTLRNQLLIAARSSKVTASKRNAFGEVFELRFSASGPLGSNDVLSVWIVRDIDGIPRLVTCYPV